MRQGKTDDVIRRNAWCVLNYLDTVRSNTSPPLVHTFTKSCFFDRIHFFDLSEWCRWMCSMTSQVDRLTKTLTNIRASICLKLVIFTLSLFINVD